MASSKFIAVKLIGREAWICDSCVKKTPFSDPIKRSPTPHCTNCGKHHPIHIACNGSSLVPPPIEYLQLFYTFPKNEIGRS